MPRRPKPSALRELDGNAGHRRANGREPVVEISLPDPPDYLDDRAREEWARVGRQLFMSRMVSSLDRANLAAYCAAVSRMERAEIELRRCEDEIHDTKIDEATRGRAFFRFNITSGMRKTAAAEVRALGIEFGLTPSARAKMRVPDAQTELPFGVLDGGKPPAPDPLEKSRRALTGL